MKINGLNRFFVFVFFSFFVFFVQCLPLLAQDAQFVNAVKEAVEKTQGKTVSKGNQTDTSIGNTTIDKTVAGNVTQIGAMVDNLNLFSSDDAAITKIDQKAAQTQQAIDAKSAQVDQVKSEATEVNAQRDALTKEILLKEDAIAIAQQELDGITAQLKVKKTHKLLKRSKELTQNIAQLQKEMDSANDKLKTVTTKAEAVNEQISANEQRIEALKDALAELKKEKAAKRSIVDKLVSSGIIVFVGIVLFFLLQLGLKKLERVISEKDAIRESETTLRIKTLAKLFSWLGTVVLVGIVIYMVLADFGLDVAPLLAGAGIIGLAFGFGGQYLIRDLINGFFILLEGQYRLNDVVQIGDFGGLVESINLRTTTLRDLEGRVVIIPNSEVKTVVNFTKEFAHALFDIGVAYKENVDRVMDEIKKLGAQMRKDQYFGRLILEDLEMLGVDDFCESHVSIKFRIKTFPIRQWEVAREFRRRLKNRFDELNIEFPFPHRTLYWGVGPDNDFMKKLAAAEYFKKQEKND
ncbi:MAG: mechanosensitive ion channel domain-containing protein [Candidatus Omnitrophota bacterium]